MWLQNVISRLDKRVTVEAEATGAVVVLPDIAEEDQAGLTSMTGLKIFGKTTQNGTPSPDAPVPLVSHGDGGSLAVSVCGKNLFDSSVVVERTAAGIKTNINTDGSIRFIGTASTGQRYIKPDDNEFLRLPAGTYTLKPNNFTLEANGGSNKFKGTFTLAEETAITSGFFSINAGTTYNQNVYIQLELGEPQTLTLHTPNGLPGIPVSSGGNYTDSTGQQWICDEVDFALGKYVQRVGRKSGSNIAWTVNAWTDDCVALDASISDVVKLDTNDDAVIRCMSTAFVGKSGANRLSKNCISVISEKRLYLLVSQSDIGVSQSNSYSDNSEAIATWWKSFGNVSVYYQLETPIETTLNTLDLIGYSKLVVDTPGTTIFNDAGAGMEVKYVANTKLYLDKKFAELAAAIVNS